ncbi:hypothetical protein HY091_02460 [Candidatus Kaiserbacteria bacterium]|nr:hypothetical protein [Candidatus Kaiserbacteria bacterium]
MDKEKETAPVHWLALAGVAVVVGFVFVVASGAGGSQINLEYFYRLLYDCIFGSCYGSIGFAGFSAWLAHLWVSITIIGYILAALALVVIVYATVRLFDLREKEEKEYGTLILAPAEAEENKRWLHIESLMGSTSASDWRQAIIEADIMLDDMLGRQGYTGAGVGEKLQQANAADFDTLQDAWEAHKVRNQIAHEGSAFALSETLARRTIARFEAVFREFDVL